jgi:hypothetical protein
MEFVLIPAGEFEMGSPSDEEMRRSEEGPVHHVNLENAFYMGRYEVTQKQWRAIMGDNPSHFKGDDLPVETVSWDDVQKFIVMLNEKEGRQNGNMPVGLALPQDIHLVMISQNLAIMRGILKIQTVRRIRSVRRSPIHGVCMICTAMSGNGCRIAGMTATTAHLLTAVHGKEMVPTGSFVAVAGGCSPAAVGLRFATSTSLTHASASSAFAF